MTSFQTLYELAAKKKGSSALLEEALPSVATSVELSKIPDDRYLSMMTRCVFSGPVSYGELLITNGQDLKMPSLSLIL